MLPVVSAIVDTKPIIDAAKNHDLEEVKRLMQEKGVPPIVKNHIAYIAASKNYLDMLKYVLDLDPLFIIKGHYLIRRYFGKRS